MKKPITPEHRQNLSIAQYKRYENSKKGEYLNQDGYLRITTKENHIKLVHVVLMEKRLGRKLKKNESIHHADGNKTNNSDENLILMTTREHRALHAKSRQRNNKGQFINNN